MTKHERDELTKICRHRERVAKSDADARAAEMRADFEKQIATIYSYDDHAVWEEAFLRARAAVEEARQVVQGTLKELGIPPAFAPSISISLWGRGENACRERRAELTEVAVTCIEAITKRAKHKIEAASVEVQTRILAGALESDDARAFLLAMPSPTDLMPLFTENEVRKIAADASRGSDAEED